MASAAGHRTDLPRAARCLLTRVAFRSPFWRATRSYNSFGSVVKTLWLRGAALVVLGLVLVTLQQFGQLRIRHVLGILVVVAGLGWFNYLNDKRRP
jgi:hypothetical protein